MDTHGKIVEIFSQKRQNRQTSTLGPQKISSKMVLQRNIAGRQSGLEDDDFRFRFLQEKILKLQVWRMENMSLFLELSGIAQEKMDVYARLVWESVWGEGWGGREWKAEIEKVRLKESDSKRVWEMHQRVQV